MFRSTPTLSRTVKGDIEEILKNGKYYYSTEIGRELNDISNAISCLDLDESILSSSNRWQKRFDPPQTAKNKAVTIEVLGKLAGYLLDYKSQMTAENIVGKQENQLRELHQWAISNLCTLKNELKPYTDGARSRLNQFSDDVGVTDRYTGYRQNLTRGYVGDSMFTRPSTAPVHQSRTGSMQQSGYYPSTQTCERNLGALGKRVTFGSEALEASEGSHYKGFYTLKQGYNPSTRTCERDSGALGRRVTFGTVPPQKSEYKGYRTIDTLYPRSNTVFVDKPHSYSQALNDTLELNNLNRTMNTPTFGLQKSKSFVASQPISVQEQAGINTTFPGDTEYMTRFTNPPENVCTSDFTINPSSDFSLTGRPLTKTTFDPSFTEYQTRYEWPDGKKIERLPWLRK